MRSFFIVACDMDDVLLVLPHLFVGVDNFEYYSQWKLSAFFVEIVFFSFFFGVVLPLN